MANTYPTLHTVLQALKHENVQSIEDVIVCLEPQSSIDKIKDPFDFKMRAQIMDKILSFLPPQDSSTYKRLGVAVISSNFDRAQKEDTDGGLVAIMGRALETDKDDWVGACMEHSFHAMFRTQNQSPQRFWNWVGRKSDNPPAMEDVARYAMKALRYRRLAQNSLQARNILELFETIVEIDEQHLSKTVKTDLGCVEALLRKAEIQGESRARVFCTRIALGQIAGSRTDQRAGPKM